MNQIDFRLSAGDKNVGTAWLPDSVSGRLPVIVYCHGGGKAR